jgi:hypothetical protein
MSNWQRFFILLLLGCAFIFGNVWQFADAQGERVKTAPKWELTRVTRSAEGWQKSQELAGDGWDFVALDAAYYYLKRPKQ